MKKGLIFLLCALLFAGLAAGAAVLLTWLGADESRVPRPVVQVEGQQLACDAFEWHEPLLGGLLYRDFSGSAGNHCDLGEIEMRENEAGAFVTAIMIEPPDGYDTALHYRTEADTQGTGDIPVDITGSLTFESTAEGRHELTITCTKPRAEGEGYGTFTYSLSFTAVAPAQAEEPPLPASPTMVTGKTDLQQGDVLSIRLYAIGEGVVPTASTDLGMAVFTPCDDDGGWYCAIPIGNTRAAGTYDVTVDAGEEFSQSVSVTVTAFDFVEQDLTIDVTDPVISEANSAAAYQQYREKIPPLFATFDEERYWEGAFIQPAEGRISTEFGTIRYTNGDYANPSIHSGMDIANAEGTPVLAPNNGRVIMAENLLNTGNTIVIEHGGGLKTYYFHLSRLDVAEGDMVEKGQLIGAIGTTGYSTGPHLHFEVRIGTQPISPHMLFEEDAGLYAAEAAQGAPS